MWVDRTLLLMGEKAMAQLQASHVLVVGVGGVGAYAAEMLCRAGVGQLTIVDADTVSETNKNRQLLALDSTIGQPKAEVMAQRLRDINPALKLTIHQVFLNEENLSSVFNFQGAGFDYVVDAIDTLAPKIALITHCVRANIPIVSAMGAGAKYDAAAVKIADISKSYNCPLAHQLRKRLGREQGIKKGVKVVFSTELPERKAIELVNEQNKKSIVGTISYLPAVFGCLCAQAVITDIISTED